MIIKRFVSAMLCVAAICMYIPQTIAAENSIFISEDYESYSEDEKPPYGDSGFTGDSLQGKSYYIEAVQTVDNNKVLALKTIGTGDNFDHSWILYRNMKINKGEVHSFSCKARTDNTNGNKRLFIRGSSSAQQTPLVQFDSSGTLKILNEKMGSYERRRWYDIKIVVNDNTKKVDVYIDNVKKGSVSLTGYDFQSEFSMRWIVEGIKSKGKESSVYIDNVLYGTGDFKYSFADMPKATDAPDDEASSANQAAKPDAAGDTVIMCLNSNKISKNGELSEIAASPKAKLGETLLPLRAIADLFGAELEWNGEEQKAIVKYNGKAAEIPLNTDIVKIADQNVRLNTETSLLNGVTYVGAELAQKLFNRVVTISSSGGIALAEDEISNDIIKKTVWDMVYARPTKEQILKDFNENGNKSHPRLLFDSDKLDEIRNNIANDALCSANYKKLKLYADQMLEMPSAVYNIDPEDISLNTSLLTVVREASEIVRNCAFVYVIEGDEKYAERAARELENAAAFPNWCPTNFLSTAEMTQCMAIGYDWLYDYLSGAQKVKIENAIMEKGLKAAEAAYDGTAVHSDEQGAAHNRMMWKEDYSNWGFVCNGGTAAGAYAIINDTNADYCADIISKAFASAAYPMTVFAPDGGWTEGIGYWTYAVEYMIYLLEGATYTLGTDYNATAVPGFDTTPFWFAAHLGPQGAFNYGDAGSSYSSSAAWLWFGRKLNDPSLISLRINGLSESNPKGSINDLIYYDKASADKVQIEKDSYYRGSETAVFRSSSGNSYENYIAVRGRNAGSHNDLDAGSFVLDAIGERWAMDLGMESYSVPNYWFWPGRGNYYRKRAEGHNTLVIEPDNGLDQTVGGALTIEKFKSGDSGGYVVMDISDSYRNKARSVKRAVGIFDDRTRFIVQDNVVCEKPSDVWWLMQTRAKIDIAEDGKSAVLSIDDKRMLMQLVSTCKEAVFTYGPAEPFETSPNPPEQSKNTGVSRLAVKSPKVTSLNMQIIFTPYLSSESPVSADIPFKPIETLMDGNVIDTDKNEHIMLDSISVNGNPLGNFDPYTHYYSAAVSEGATSIVTAEGDGDIEIIQADSAPGINKPVNAKIRVSDPSGKLKASEYTVTLTLQQKQMLQEIKPDAEEINVKSVSASVIAEAENPPEKTIDGDVTTKWSGEGTQWIEYDLGSEQTISAIGLYWMTPSARKQNFGVEISTDGKTYTGVFDGQSSGTAIAMEYLMLDNVTARYVRVNVNGTSAGGWTSLMETKFYGEILTENEQK